MKIIYAAITFVLLCITVVSAQNQQVIDSINNELIKSLSDTTRVQSLIALAEEHYLFSPALAIEDCEKALQISTKIEYYKGMSASFGWLAYLHEQQGDITKAINYNLSALKLAKKTGSKKNIATIYNNMAAIYQNLGKLDLAIEYNNRCIKIREEIADKPGIATSNNNIGLLMFQQGKIPDALDYYHRALLIYEELEIPDGISTALMNIGAVHKDQMDYDKARSCFDRALNISINANDKYAEGYSLNGIGTLFMALNEPDSAIYYFNHSLAVRKSIDDKQGVSYALKNIGEIMLVKKELASAKTFFKESLKGFTDMDDKKGMASTLNQIGKLLLQERDYNNSEINLKRSLSLAKEIASPSLIRDAAENLQQLYRVKSDWKNALTMQDLFISMRDSINNNDNKKAMLQAQFKYEYEQKEIKLLADQEKKQLLANAESRKQKILLYSFLCGLILTVLLLFFVFRNYSNQKKANRLLKEAQDQLIQSEKMAAFGVMASRVAHEIQNPLNFVNNFSELSKDLVEEFLQTDSETEKKELAGELITNLEKINHHGNRAGEIVRQLQEHSRQGTAHAFFEND